MEYDTGIIKPKGVINVDRMRSQRRVVLRVLLSLSMQENTQSNIIRRLNSQTRYTRLKAALFEYNGIFKSIHAINLIGLHGVILHKGTKLDIGLVGSSHGEVLFTSVTPAKLRCRHEMTEWVTMEVLMRSFISSPLVCVIFLDKWK